VLAGCTTETKAPPRPHARSNRPYSPPPLVFGGDSKALKQTAIIPTLDSPMPGGKNVVWCASFPMAWDRLKQDVVHEPIRVANAEAVAGRLNKAAVNGSDLPDGSYYAAAGLEKDGIAERIRREMRERFQKEPTDLNNKSAAILAYSYLRAAVPFTLPFFENDEKFQFTDGGGKKTKVSSFGLRPKDESDYRELRNQVEILYVRPRDEWQPKEFVLDLCRDSQPNQVLVVYLPKKATLSEMLNDMKTKIAENRPDESDRRLGSNSDLLIPALNFKVSHHFTELEGPDKRLLNAGFRELWLDSAIQAIDFRLDRSGVELEAKSHAVFSAIQPAFVLDHPFLIVVKKRGAEHPFFAMWVDNAELLCKP
jgi:hypothetical protein